MLNEIRELNTELIGKFDLKSSDAWILEMYKQFGFENFEQIKELSKTDPNWFNKFKWAIYCEDQFIEEVLKKNKKQAKKIGINKIKHDFAWMSLEFGPGILGEKSN